MSAVAAALAGSAEPVDRVPLAALPSLVAGAELAAVRLIVAAADPDTETVAVEQAGARDG